MKVRERNLSDKRKKKKVKVKEYLNKMVKE